MTHISLGGDLIYRPCAEHPEKAKILRALSPGLVPGLHYALNGPVHNTIAIYGNLTIFDTIKLRVLCLLGLPNRRLEVKLRAIANAFREEAALLEMV